MATLRVPQRDGEITISQRGEAKTYHVKDHEVHVNSAELERFLQNVKGSKEVSAKPAKTAKEGDN